jgi:hypothetical protein
MREDRGQLWVDDSGMVCLLMCLHACGGGGGKLTPESRSSSGFNDSPLYGSTVLDDDHCDQYHIAR